MMRWLRSFFYSDDPIVKIAAGLSQPIAEMLRELLKNEAIPAFNKNMRFLSVTYGWSTGNEFDIWVRQSDLERAQGILEPLIEPAQLVDQD